MKSSSLLTFLLLSIACVQAVPICRPAQCVRTVSKRQPQVDFGSIGDFVGGLFGGSDEETTASDSGSTDDASVTSSADEDTTDIGSSVGDFFSGLVGGDDNAVDDTTDPATSSIDSGDDNASATSAEDATDIDSTNAVDNSDDVETEEVDDATAATTDNATTEATSPPPPALNLASATCPPDINAATVNLIKEFEGFVASPEPDPIGLPTVGFGHLCKQSGCSEVPFSFPLSQTTAAQLLQTDIKTFTKCINNFVKVPLNENQFGALTAFTFNLGCGTLQSSTLLKRLNAGEDPNTVAAQELPKFNKAGGKVLAGLTRRRNAEVALFQTSSNTGAIPCN